MGILKWDADPGRDEPFGSSVPQNETQIAEMGPGAGRDVTDERSAVEGSLSFSPTFSFPKGNFRRIYLFGSLA